MNALVEGLSRRGVREAELRQNLMDERQKVVQALPKCPAHKLNTLMVSFSLSFTLLSSIGAKNFHLVCFKR